MKWSVRRILPLIIIWLFFGFQSFSQTHIGAGNVSGTWFKAFSPYVIDGNVTIQADKKLTIEPGVQVLFGGYYKITVNGTLVAKGTKADSIIFDALDKETTWHSLRVEDVAVTSDSTIFEYCRMAHAAYVIGTGVHVGGGNAVIVKNFNKVRVSHCLMRNIFCGRGAGVYAENADIRIFDNVIRNNSAEQYGTGIYVLQGSPSIKRNRIEHNYGEGGAGMWLDESESVIEDNIVSYNSTYWSGGGMVISSDVTLLRNVISYNDSGHDDGGGLLVNGGSPKIINNTIVFNKAIDGEGVLVVGSATPDFINTIIYSNRDLYDDVNNDDEIYLDYGTPKPNFYNCDIQGGVEGIRIYSGTYQGTAVGNINKKPFFKDATNNDFHQTWENYPAFDGTKSPAIDAGSADSPHDPDGSRADIGAFYFHQEGLKSPPRVDFVADTVFGYNTLAVQFTDETDQGTGTLTTWSWSFGDGETSTEQNPVHTYTTDGWFNVTLTVKDDDGFEMTLTKERYVRILAGTYIKGTISGALEGKRYLVGGDLLVAEMTKVTVPPGAEFVFTGNYIFEVRGALQAKGTAESPIVFTSFDTTGFDHAHAVDGFEESKGAWKGVYIYATGGQDSTIIDHCQIQFVENNGQGAIYAFAANGAKGIRISNSDISYNSVQGIVVFSSDLIIRNNYIHHNYSRAYQPGAGIFVVALRPKIINNVISFNKTADDGGGIRISDDGRPSIVGNTITHNAASRAGGICDYAGWMDVVNNTIAYNTATNNEAGGYYILYAGDVTFTNNIFAHNYPAQVEVADQYTRVGFRNCILEGGTAAILGYKTNIFINENVGTDDPMLVEAGQAHGKLLPGSPAINAGTTTNVLSLLPAFDLLGNARIDGAAIDIGAYEYVAETPVTVANEIPDYLKDEDFESFLVPLKDVFEYKDGTNYLAFAIDNSSSINLLKADVRGLNIYIEALKDRFGDQTIDISASNGSGTVTTSFVVEINPIDDPATFAIEGDIILDEDFAGPRQYDIVYHVPFGEEGQHPKFELDPVSASFVNVNFNPDGTLSFSPKPNAYGLQQFTLTLSEGDDTSAKTFEFAVASVNDAPVISLNQTQVVLSVGETQSVPFSVSDIEGDAVIATVNHTFYVSTANQITGSNQYLVAISGISSGIGYAIITADDGSDVAIDSIKVNVDFVDGLEDEHISPGAYPNPANDFLFIKAKPNSSVVMYSTTGSRILQDTIIEAEQQIDLRNVSPGLYLLTVDDGDRPKTFKILKQ